MEEDSAVVPWLLPVGEAAPSAVAVVVVVDDNGGAWLVMMRMRGGVGAVAGVVVEARAVIPWLLPVGEAVPSVVAVVVVVGDNEGAWLAMMRMAEVERGRCGGDEDGSHSILLVRRFFLS